MKKVILVFSLLCSVAVFSADAQDITWTNRGNYATSESDIDGEYIGYQETGQAKLWVLFNSDNAAFLLSDNHDNHIDFVPTKAHGTPFFIHFAGKRTKDAVVGIYTENAVVVSGDDHQKLLNAFKMENSMQLKFRNGSKELIFSFPLKGFTNAFNAIPPKY